MKAFVFGHLNNLPVIVTGYHQFKFGPYIRGEKSKRHYNNNFTFQKNVIGEQIDKWRVLQKYYQVEHEPSLRKIDRENDDTLYEFASLPSWNDYFSQLKNYRHIVIQILWSLVKEQIKQQIYSLTKPCIGVHIRMGDFRKLNQGEDFSKVGAVRTPEDYFIEVIQSIRNLSESELPVALFTDGYKSELKKVLAMKNINIVEGNPDIVDLLLLSRSKIIVTSAGSTFSYWAGFLSNAPIIMHPDHIHASIREKEKGQLLYEGPVYGLTKEFLNLNKVNEEID